MAKDQMCKHLLEKPTAGNRLDITCLNLELHAIFFLKQPSAGREFPCFRNAPAFKNNIVNFKYPKKQLFWNRLH